MPEPEAETRFHPRLVLGAVLVVLIFVFIVENTRQTKMRFLVPEVTAPLWTALFAAALLGALAGALVARRRAGPGRRGSRAGRRPPENPSK